MNIKDLDLAKFYFENNEINKSEMILNKIINSDKENTKANEILGYINANKGKLNEAKYYLEKACDKKDSTAEANYYLGRLNIKIKEYKKAIINIKKSINIGGPFFEGYIELGVAQNLNGDINESIKSIKKALEINNESTDAWSYLGELYYDIKQIKKSLICFENAIKINKDIENIWINKSLIYREMKIYSKAIESIEVALKINDKSEKARNEYGLLLLEMGNYEESILQFNKAIEKNRKYIPAIINKTAALNKINKYSESINEIEKLLSYEKNNSEAWCNKGVALLNLKNYIDALKCFDIAIELNKENYIAYSNMGIIYNTLNRYQESIDHYYKAIEINRNYADAHYNMAHAYFNLGEFTKAWREYEWRFKTTKYGYSYSMNIKKWKGDKNNKTLYIISEQGVGDEILYSSVLNEISNYPQEKICIINKKLKIIFERSFPEIKFINKINHEEIKNDDQFIYLGSLAGLKRNKIDDFNKAKFPYLIDNKERTNAILEKLSKTKKKCGISWRSFGSEISDEKSIDLINLEEILKRFSKEYEWINLQYSIDKISDNEKKILNEYNFKILEENNLFNNIDNLLSIINSCDLIITCSNINAHIAGALKKDTLLLLPHGLGKLWYWKSFDNNKSYWYPSVKIIQQSQGNVWCETVEKIRTYIEGIK